MHGLRRTMEIPMLVERDKKAKGFESQPAEQLAKRRTSRCAGLPRESNNVSLGSKCLFYIPTWRIAGELARLSMGGCSGIGAAVASRISPE
jgi:hypothetical protein